MANRSLLLPVIAYAALGLAISLFVHILSFADISVGGNALFIGLHAGIFPLWLVLGLLIRRSTGSSQPRHYWKVLLSGCPPWMKYMTYGFFAYTVVNFAIFFVTTAMTKQSAPGAVPASVVHGFSGHWMAFYSAGLAAATTFYRRGWSPSKCPNGHTAGYGARFCSTCGAAIAVQQQP